MPYILIYVKALTHEKQVQLSQYYDLLQDRSYLANLQNIIKTKASKNTETTSN